jgi:hypothetical protein
MYHVIMNDPMKTRKVLSCMAVTATIKNKKIKLLLLLFHWRTHFTKVILAGTLAQRVLSRVGRNASTSKTPCIIPDHFQCIHFVFLNNEKAPGLTVFALGNINNHMRTHISHVGKPHLHKFISSARSKYTYH